MGSDLKRLTAGFHYDRSVLEDPLYFVRNFAKDPRAAEITGVFASTVAVGNVKSIHTSIEGLLEIMDEDPRGFVEGFNPVRWRDFFHPWKHRWIRADQMGFLALRLREIYGRYPGGLEEVFLQGSRAIEDGPASELRGGWTPSPRLSGTARWMDLRPTTNLPPVTRGFSPRRSLATGPPASASRYLPAGW